METCPPVLVNDIAHRPPCPSFTYSDAMPPVMVEAFSGIFLVLGVIGIACLLLLLITFTLSMGRD